MTDPESDVRAVRGEPHCLRVMRRQHVLHPLRYRTVRSANGQLGRHFESA
jgi:hypothetical protein